MARIISKKQPFSAGTPSLQQLLQRKNPVPKSEYVAIRDLARELRVDPERLRPLIDRCYLTILEMRDYLDDCMVARPAPAAIAWLRMMFLPVSLRPMLSTEMAAQAVGVPVNALRSLCLAYNVQLQDDPALGELISMKGLHSVITALYSNKGVNRFDRQALLCMLSRTTKGAVPKMQSYSVRLEQEISRIAKLPEPDRSFRAVALYDAYQESKIVQECISKYRAVTRVDTGEIEQKFAELLNRSFGTTESHHDAQCDDEPDAPSSASSRRA